MRKTLLTLLSATLIFSANSFASNTYENQQTKRLKSFVERMNSLNKSKSLLEVYERPEGDSYKTQRQDALSSENLSHVSLEDKFELIHKIFLIRRAIEDYHPCEPVHVAQAIYDSMPTGEYEDLTTLLKVMKNFHTLVMPQTDNILKTNWIVFTHKLAASDDYSKPLRRRAVALYSKLNPDRRVIVKLIEMIEGR